MKIQTLKDVETAAKKQLNNYNKRMAKFDWHTPKESVKFPLKLRKRTVDFVGPNVYFNPVEMKATSYDWWIFVKQIKGKVVFNSYMYSNSTSKHQRKVKEVMSQLGIKIDLQIEASKGLQNLESAIEGYEYDNRRLASEIEKPRSHKETNKRRAAQIKANLKTIAQIKELLK